MESLATQKATFNRMPSNKTTNLERIDMSISESRTGVGHGTVKITDLKLKDKVIGILLEQHEINTKNLELAQDKVSTLSKLEDAL